MQVSLCKLYFVIQICKIIWRKQTISCAPVDIWNMI